jgi:hypothetical protein
MYLAATICIHIGIPGACFLLETDFVFCPIKWRGGSRLMVLYAIRSSLNLYKGKPCFKDSII